MSEIIGNRPSQREVQQYLLTQHPNRHDRRRLAELGFRDERIVKNTVSGGKSDVDVIFQISRFQGVFIGRGDLGNWNWISHIQYTTGKREYLRHYKHGSAKFNMVTLVPESEEMTFENPSRAAIFREAMGPGYGGENPFE